MKMYVVVIANLLLIGLVGGVVIEPQNPVVRLGQTARLMCKVRGPIKSCLWEINGELYNLQEGAKYQPFGVHQDGECGIQATITEAENGQWTCRVFVEGVVDRAERATTNVTLLALPQITLRPNADPITVIAGESSDIQCVVADARPTPAIMWMIGDREIDASNRHTVAVPRRDGMTTITDTLRYAFQAGDHGQIVRCLTTGPWLNMDDQHDAFAHLNVIFPPQPKDPSTLYGFQIGAPGDVTVNFTANPRPVRIYWKLDDGSELMVEPFGGRASPDNRYEVFELRNTNASAYEARLRIKTIADTDARRILRLFVESDLNGEPMTQEYVVRISTSPAPLTSGGVSGGGIAAIIIVLLAVLVIVAVSLYARNTGRWCFAGRNKAVGVSTKPESADEEAGGAGDQPNEQDPAIEQPPRQHTSLTHRLSSLYESLLSKAAPKKSGAACQASAATEPTAESKEGNVVYAELDLKAPAEADVSGGTAVRMTKEETTEYAEIVPIQQPSATTTTTSSPTKTAE